MNNQEAIYDYIKTQELMVISTLNENGEPESALVGFAETKDLELIFGTYIASRKHKNLQTNQKVSVVIGHTGPQTVQFEGIATEASADEVEDFKNLMVTKNPKTKKFVDNPDERFYKITPTWVRYTDLSKESWDIREI